MKTPNLTHLIKTFQLEEGKTIKLNKQGFIEAMCQLDLETISEILQDDKPYSETTKAVFLEKLDALFLQFKTAGDTCLIPHEGKCCIAAETCPNTNKKGVTFVGNHSGRDISFVIETQANHTINDIYVCHYLEAPNFKSDPNKQPLDFFVFFDEKADFNPTLEYLKTNAEATKALDALVVLKSKASIPKQDIINWTNTYKELKDSFEFPPLLYKNISTLFWIYSSIEQIATYFKLDTQAHKALQDFKAINSNIEIELLKWLVTYEDLHFQLILMLGSFVSKDDISKDKIELSCDSEFFFKTKDINNCIDFEDVFDTYYYDNLNKYTTKTPEEQANQIPWDDDEALSLKYHLEKRGML